MLIIKNKKGDVTPEFAHSTREVKGLLNNEFINLDEWTNLVKKYNLPNLAEAIENLNSLIFNEETEVISENLLTKKPQAQMVSPVNASKDSGKTTAPMSRKHFHRTEGRSASQLPAWGHQRLTAKPVKRLTHGSTSPLSQGVEIPSKVSASQLQKHIKRVSRSRSSGFHRNP